MTASFKTLALADNRILVKGTDQFDITNQVVLDGSEWAELNNKFDYDDATEAYAVEVEKFFAPLTAAAEKLGKDMAKPQDPAQFVVVQEHVCATEGQDAVVLKLSHDSTILRLIEAGDFDRLIWVGDSLEITEYVVPTEGKAVHLSESEAVDLLKGMVSNMESVVQGATGQAEVTEDTAKAFPDNPFV